MDTFLDHGTGCVEVQIQWRPADEHEHIGA
jgi:hypothetical protein